MKTLLAKIQGFFVRLWAWLCKDGKTTAIAAVYACAETMLAMPDFATMTREDFLRRTIRILSVTAIGIFARDRKKLTPDEITAAEDKHNVPEEGRKNVEG